MSRIKDWTSRNHLKVTISDRGYVGSQGEAGYISKGETALKVVVEGAISGNTIQPQGKLVDQTDWQDIGSAIASVSVGTAVDVSRFDMWRLKTTAFMGVGSVNEVQTATPSTPPDAGTYKLNFGGSATANIAWDASAATIQAALRLLPGLDLVTVSGTLATAVIVTFVGYKGNAAMLTVTDNLLTVAAVPITLPIAQTTLGVAGADVTVIASGFY